MKKSGKVKNPCKICFESVNKKKGLQCQGACQKWAHYKCLEYSPGKIQDIKAGNVIITCPCPDCNPPTQPKCPSKPQTCNSGTGQSVKQPIPCYLPLSCSGEKLSPCRMSPKCSNASVSPCLSLMGTNTPQIFTACPPNRNQTSKQTSPHLSPQGSQCPAQCPNRKSQSTSALLPKVSSSGSGIHLKCIPKRIASSDSKLSVSAANQKELICTLDEMCRTVGKLSCQLRELMCKMLETKYQ